MDVSKYNLTEAELRLFDWYCDYQPQMHHRNGSGSGGGHQRDQRHRACSGGAKDELDGDERGSTDPLDLDTLLLRPGARLNGKEETGRSMNNNHNHNNMNNHNSNMNNNMNSNNNSTSAAMLRLQREVLEAQKALLAEQGNMCRSVVGALADFMTWLNNNTLQNNNGSCKNCRP